MKTVTFSHAIHPPSNWRSAFTANEQPIVVEVIRILNAHKFKRIKSGYEYARYAEISINRVKIIYMEDEDNPCNSGVHGISFISPAEFYILCDAWKSRATLIKTVAHELHRIRTSTIGFTGSIAVGESTIETRNADHFANRVNRIFR